MRMKTFQGRSLEEILPNIRKEFGEDAVVLSTRQIVNGGIGGFFGKRGVEVTAADQMPTDDELVDLEDSFGADQGKLPVDDSAARDAISAAIARGVDPARSSRLDVTDADDLDTAQLIAATMGPSESDLGLSATAEMRMATSAYGRSGAGFEPAVLPERTPTKLDTSQLANAMLMGSAGSADLRDPATHEATARAHQALADAASEIRQQLGLAEDAPLPSSAASTSFSARVSDATMSVGVPLRSASPQLGTSISPSEPVSRGFSHSGGASLHNVGRPSIHGPSPQLLAELSEAARALQHYLCVTGVNAEVAQSVVGTVIEHRRPFSPDGDLRTLVRDVIAETVRCSTGWSHAGRTHKVAFVGPSGAGKSTTVAKLAEGYMRGSGYRVGVISISVAAESNAASHSIAADPLLRRPNLDVRFVSSPEQMKAAVDHMHECDLIMIDTPSTAYLDQWAMQITAACLAVARVDETHVVVPLATSVREAESVIRHFQPLHVNRLAVTKLDESRYAGQLLNFGFRFGLPITFLSDGPQIPEDLRAASAREIAELIVPPHPRSPES